MVYLQKLQKSPVFRLKLVYTIVLYLLGFTVTTVLLVISFFEINWLLVFGVATVHGLLDYFAPYIEIKRQDRSTPTRIFIEITEVPSFFAVVVLGPYGVLSVVIATFVITRLVPQSKWLETLDVISQRSILYFLMLSIYWLYPVTLIPFTSFTGVVCLILIIVLYPLMYNILSALQYSSLLYQPFTESIRRNFQEKYFISMIAVTMGGLASILWYVQPLLVVLVALPLFLAQQATQSIVKNAAARAQMREIAQAKEQAEAASRFKSQFISMVSHDLRTPLNAIINYAQFLSKPRYGGLTERQQDIQQRLLVNASQLLTLVNNLLDRAKIEAGHIQYQPNVVDLPALVQGCVDGVQGLADERDLTLQVDFTGTLLYSWCDSNLVHQVVMNLLSNAIKFTSYGGVCVRVERYSAQYVIIVVNDTGIGIAPEQHDYIFDEFHQIPNPTMLQQHGSGLGLAICKRLVELQNGTMWFESEVGSGSTFYVRLPVPVYEEIVPSSSVAGSTDTVQS